MSVHGDIFTTIQLDQDTEVCLDNLPRTGLEMGF